MDGEGTLCYQWIKDGKPLSEEIIPNCFGCDSSELEITSFSSEHEGSYRCIVRNKDNEQESNDAHLHGNFKIDVDAYKSHNNIDHKSTPHNVIDGRR